jgi:hypothetical protein
MQILTPLQGEMLSALGAIVLGILMEKHYVSWWSVAANVFTTFTMFATLDLGADLAILAAVYLILGGLTAWKDWKAVYVLFGSKTYGSLALTLGMLDIPFTREWLISTASTFGFPTQTELTLALFGWLLIGIIVHIIGEVYTFVRPAKKKKEF